MPHNPRHRPTSIGVVKQAPRRALRGGQQVTNPDLGRSATKAQTKGRTNTLTRPKVSVAQTIGRTDSVSGTLTRAPTTSAPSGPSPTTAAPAGTAPGPADAGAGIEIEAIEAAIAAIEAQFGLTKEQLLADDSEIGRTYRLLIAQVNRANEASIEAVLGNALERGIVRSGIFAENVAEVETLTAETVSDLASQQAAQQASIQTQISQAEAAAAQAKLTAAQERGGQVLSLEELDALINAGLA